MTYLLKVLMIISNPEFGGTETHVLCLSKILRKYGIQVGIATYGGPFLRQFRSQGVHVHWMMKNKTSSSAAAASNVSRIVKKHTYSIVHVHDFESFRMLPHLSKKLPNTPLVMTVHGNYYSKSELRRAATPANLVIAVSPIVRQRLIQSGVPARKIMWIPNGIDVQRYSPTTNPNQYKRMLHLPINKKICVYAGRFQSDKWRIAKKLILAAEPIARKDGNFILLLIGFGHYRTRLARLAKQMNERLKRTAIYVLPPTNHIQNYYRAATLVVGTGRVALEAMSCGKPVIAVGLAGYEGIVEPKRLTSSIVHHFGDHAALEDIRISRLSNDMYKLLANPKRSRFLGHYGRKVVHRRFSIRRIAAVTRKAYLNL